MSEMSPRVSTLKRKLETIWKILLRNRACQRNGYEEYVEEFHFRQCEWLILIFEKYNECFLDERLREGFKIVSTNLPPYSTQHC